MRMTPDKTCHGTVRRRWLALALLALLVTNCGGPPIAAPTAAPDIAPPASTAGPTAAAAADAAPTAASDNSAGDLEPLDRVRKAVIRIEAEGTFFDPDTQQQSAQGWGGSGFIIDPS